MATTTGRKKEGFLSFFSWLEMEQGRDGGYRRKVEMLGFFMMGLLG